MQEVTEQRPMNNECAQIHELANCQAGPQNYAHIASELVSFKT